MWIFYNDFLKKGPKVVENLLSGIQVELQKMNIKNITELRGIDVNWAVERDTLKIILLILNLISSISYCQLMLCSIHSKNKKKLIIFL